ncbi:MAG TPA: hypothetical protein VHM00_02770 [Caldimonas sp.]|nr:hypothetical protein [Caldimonas sp.]HEX2539985.1 hypothetical protein [Caldimonas sp.]
MTNPNSLEKRQMAEPRPAPEGADVGGMASTADAGLGRATQRSTEHAESDPVAPASTGHASGGAQTPRIDMGGKAEPGSVPGTTESTRRPAADRQASGAPASSGRAAGAGGVGGAEPTGSGAVDDEDEDEWRHEPRPAVDESPLKSFGKSIGEALTGSVDDPPDPAKKGGR